MEEEKITITFEDLIKIEHLARIISPDFKIGADDLDALRLFLEKIYNETGIVFHFDSWEKLKQIKNRKEALLVFKDQIEKTHNWEKFIKICIKIYRKDFEYSKDIKLNKFGMHMQDIFFKVHSILDVYPSFY